MRIIDLIDELELNRIYVSLDGEDIELSFEGEEIDSNLLGKIKENKQELVGFLQKTSSNSGYQNILPLEKRDYYPISHNQKRIWILSQFEGGSIVWNMPLSIVLKGAYSQEILNKSIESVIERHEILRTVFKKDSNGEPHQFILSTEKLGFELEYKNFSEEKNPKEKTYDRIKDDSNIPFDLENGPLIRASLFQTAKDEYIFYLNIHHIISDGWSLEILSRDILFTYEAYSLGQIPNLPNLRIQYKDFTAWQLNQVQDINFNKHREFWKNELSGELPVLELPTSKVPPKTMTYNGYQLRTYIEPNLTKDLKSLSKEFGGSLFIQLLAAWNNLLYRYLNQKDIIIGTLVAGREHPELENQIGYYVNTLSLRNTIIPGESFSDLFKRVKEKTLTTFAHQAYPFDSLLEELNIPRDMSRTPIFDVLLVLHNIKEQKKTYEELDKDIFDKIQDIGPVFSKFPIELEFKELGEYLSFDIKYNADIYDKELIENLIKHYKKLLSEIVRNPQKSINKIDFLEDEERNKLLYSFNDTKMSYPNNKSIIDIFEQEVQKAPNNIAVIYKENKLTFSELNALSNKYAQSLSQNIGLKAGDKIIVSLVHDHKLLAVLLAVKKLGAIYVPVDPQTPEERIKHIKDLSGSIEILDSKAFFELEQDALKIDEEITNWNRPEQSEIEFIIYTSGSTGIPKGVLIKSSSVNNRLNWMWNNYPFAENEVCCAKTSISFVDHIWEFFGPLLKGIPLVFYRKDEIIDVPNFIKNLSKEKVTRIVLVPSLLRAMLRHTELCKEKLNKLNIWISSGEALKKRDVDTFYKVLNRNNVRLLNIYGSTEVTADATYYDTYDDYNLRKPFSLFDSSIKDNIDELISSYDTSLEIVSNSFEKLLKKNNFKNIDFKASGNTEEYMKLLKSEIIPNIINVGVPKYIGHMTGPIPNFIRQLNELITVLNQNQVKIETSMAATLIEKQVVGIFHNLVYQKDQDFYDQYIQDPRTPLGVVTNGGTMSNIMAMSYTLNNALKAKDDFRGLTEEGLLNAMKFYGYEKIVLLGSTWCHYSFSKALKILGLGKESFVPLNFEGKENDVIRKELINKIEELRSQNALILGIVGIAGTTESGNIDPLPVLGKVANECNIHFHVDASFGGSFLVDDELRKKFKGIQYADSVSVCAHKQLYIPIGLSICVFKNPGFALSSENNTHYQARKGSYDLGKFTIEGSRNFMTLTLHAVFHVFGKEGFAEIIRHNYATAQFFAKLIKSSTEFRLLYEPDLNIVLYRYIPVDLRGKEKFNDEELILINDLNKAIYKDQFERGESFVSYTEIQMQDQSERHLAFRTVFMNPYTTHNDLRSILEEQKMIATKLEGKPINFETSRNESILIGKPIENVKVYILDEFLNLLPIGVIGEICVSGDCISAGYVNLLEESSNKFVEDPFVKGERLFRTGDLGRRLTDGNIEFVARKDDQVKIRGHRIELGEIETALLQFSDTIKQVVAETKEVNNEKVLVAYYVTEAEIEKIEIRNYIQSKLPEYMVPGFYVELESLPLTSSGKIDRKALPNVTGVDIIRKEYVAPKNETEQQLVEIWENVLGINEIGITDDFFELGGHSIKAIKIISKTQKKFNVKIHIGDVFEDPTIKGMADKIDIQIWYDKGFSKEEITDKVII